MLALTIRPVFHCKYTTCFSNLQIFSLFLFGNGVIFAYSVRRIFINLVPVVNLNHFLRKNVVPDCVDNTIDTHADGDKRFWSRPAFCSRRGVGFAQGL
jgi:hypothetical protein